MESRPFFLSHHSIWSLPSLRLSSLAITAFRGPEGYFDYVTVAFGAFKFIVPKYSFSPMKNGQQGSRP